MMKRIRLSFQKKKDLGLLEKVVSLQRGVGKKRLYLHPLEQFHGHIEGCRLLKLLISFSQ